MSLPVPPKRAGIETKTQAAGLAGVVAGELIWILGEYVFKGTVNPGLVSLVYAAVPGVLAFAAAWLAPHTPRPAPPAPAPAGMQTYTPNITVSVPPPPSTTPPPSLPGGDLS
jgi:hypothetical protein